MDEKKELWIKVSDRKKQRTVLDELSQEAPGGDIPVVVCVEGETAGRMLPEAYNRTTEGIEALREKYSARLFTKKPWVFRIFD